MSPRVTLRRTLGQDRWDALVEASDEGWLWHRYDLQDALEAWPGSTDESFALLGEDDAPLALVPLRRITRRKAGVLRLHVLESLGGIAIRNGLPDKTRRTLLQAARARLTERGHDGVCLETRLALPAMAPAFRGPRVPRVNPLLEIGCANTLTQTWVVDLAGGRNAVWTAMEGRARTAIRKAERAGVTVREAGADDLDTYYRLHQENYRRTGAVPHARRYFEFIWERFLTQGLARIWLAILNSEAVAAENFGVYKQAAIYWTGAASAQGLAVEANSLLQWTAMQWMIDNGIAWYETGEAFPQAVGGKNKGLNDFKRSFGGNIYPFYKGRLRSGGMAEKIYRALKEYRQ
jgi:hypothetical protein